MSGDSAAQFGFQKVVSDFQCYPLGPPDWVCPRGCASERMGNSFEPSRGTRGICFLGFGFGPAHADRKTRRASDCPSSARLQRRFWVRRRGSVNWCAGAPGRARRGPLPWIKSFAPCDQELQAAREMQEQEQHSETLSADDPTLSLRPGPSLDATILSVPESGI